MDQRLTILIATKPVDFRCGRPVVRRHLRIAAVDLGLVEAGPDHTGLQVVGVLCPERLCALQPALQPFSMTAGHITIIDRRATRVVLARSARLAFGEVPPKMSKALGKLRAPPASS
jgi:hypothetical protein